MNEDWKIWYAYTILCIMVISISEMALYNSFYLFAVAMGMTIIPLSIYGFILYCKFTWKLIRCTLGFHKWEWSDYRDSYYCTVCGINKR